MTNFYLLYLEKQAKQKGPHIIRYRGPFVNTCFVRQIKQP